MSSTSIDHQGYTSPQFLEKICRGTPSLSSHHSYNRPNLYSSSNILPSSNQPIYSSSHSIPTPIMPTKLIKTHSLSDQDRISTTKFRLFFKTIADSIFQEQDIASIWHRFQNSLNNPFQFDRFIEDMRRKSQNKKQQKQKSPLILSQIRAEPSKLKYKSLPKFTKNQNTIDRVKSVGKYPKSDSISKQNLLRREITYLSKVIMHGQKFIQSK